MWHRQPRSIFARTAAVAAVLVSAPSWGAPGDDDAWRPVTGTSYSVGGLARFERAGAGSGQSAAPQQFLAVHDNKSDTTPRVSLLTVTVGPGAGDACRITTLSLEWPEKDPPK